MGGHMPATDEQVAEFLPTVDYLARKAARRAPPSVTADDLASAGNEGLLEAARTWDPEQSTWVAYAREIVQRRMLDEVRNLTGFRRKTEQPAVRGMPVDPETGDLIPVADRRQNDPGDIAAVRELAATPGTVLAVNRVRDALPPPDAVAARATALRAAMFDAVTPEDVAAATRAVVSKAKGGNLTAFKLLTDLLQPARSGTVVQQAVVINPRDAAS